MAFGVVGLDVVGDQGPPLYAESPPGAELSPAPGAETAAPVPAVPTPEGGSQLAGPPNVEEPAGARVPSLAAPVVARPSPRFVSTPGAKSQRVPLAHRWWFWAGLGTAAVGVVLAAIFLGPRDPYSGNATPGTVQIF